MGYQIERGDYFETFDPAASATSNRLVVVTEDRLGFKGLGCRRGFIQPELDTDIYLHVPSGRGSVSGKMVRLNKVLCIVKRSGRARYQLLSSSLVECGFEQCLLDPCVFRLRLARDAVAMVEFHVDGIIIAVTEEVYE
ncbi:unnamed protein product, partial [Sphacelaria rigidula]